MSSLLVMVYLVALSATKATLVDNPGSSTEIPILVGDNDKVVKIADCKDGENPIIFSHKNGDGTLDYYGVQIPKEDYVVALNTYKGYELTIHKMTREKAGRYTCFVPGKEGPPIKTFNLIYKEPPVIINSTNSTIAVQEGETVELVCVSSSVTPHHTRWYIGHFIDIANLTQVTTFVGINGNVLRIKNITRRCSASYICKAINEIGEVKKNFSVSVKHKPSLTLVVNEMTGRADYSVNSADPLIISCKVRAVPAEQYISWHIGKNEAGSWNQTTNKVETNNKFARHMNVMKDTEALKLTIEENSPFLKGKETFKCTAINSEGPESSSVVISFT